MLTIVDSSAFSLLIIIVVFYHNCSSAFIYGSVFQLFSTDDMLPNLTSDVTNVGGSSGGNNSQVVTYQTPSFLDLISPDEPVDESEVKLK